jgi:hypothetical protein
MLQGTPQFTPKQLLDAARRSETERKADFAVQFYLHLIENYGQTPEAVEARSALTRMATAELPAQPVWQPGSVARQDRYRSGRALAALFGLIGWLSLAGSLAVLAAGAGARLLHIPLLLQLEIDIGLLQLMPLALLGGAALVVCSQLARALFDQANATRERLTIERARTGIDQG